MDTEKKVFRKSFLGGFSKEDVNKYIADASEKFNEEKEALSERLHEAEEKNRTLSAGIAAANDRIEALSKENEELPVLRARCEELEKALEEKTAEAERLSSENVILRSREAALSEVEREYASRKTELADIEISARSRATDIVAEAENNAIRIRAELERTLCEKKREFEAEKNALFTETGDTVAAVTKLLSALKTEVESMDIKILRMSDSLRTNILSLSDAVGNANDKACGVTERLMKACEEKE
ncbi:MAG: hypothetical protein E7473_09345 [Ruminococcaceae bacterium]|nr:hypothetical protein [Oscillospiraceae bacterium]